MDYYRQYGVNIKIVRIFNTYGPRMAMDDGRVVSNFIVQALRGEPLTVYGNGSQTRSFMYIDDLLDGMLRMMATGDGVTGPVNIGNPYEISVLTLAEMVLAITNSKSEVIFQELPSDDPKVRCPFLSGVQQILDNWKPSVDLHHGLEKTIKYFMVKV